MTNLWKLVVVLASTLALLSCSSSPVPTVSAAQPAPPGEAPAIVLNTAPDDAGFTASGPIIVENQVDVTAQREGVVAKIVAETGFPVKRGQLLAQLDDRQLSADLEAARAKTRSIAFDLKNWEAEAKVLEADYARARKLWDAQVITKEQLEHAQYKAESDQWDVKRVQELLINSQNSERSLELELEKTQVRAPFDGVVARRYVRGGEAVVRDQRLFWVTAIAPMRVRVTLPARFIGQIKAGSSASVLAAEGAPGPEYRAKVLQVSPVVDPSSDTIEVLAELSGPATGLHPGMRANVRFPNPR
ncbi:MAG TPA: efflux RND transporter periplasmic adaptor subunit [Terriglobales bacterium]